MAALFNHKELSFATFSPSDVDKKSVEQAIPPNWIHSLDASHMFCTLDRATDSGIYNLSMIHDSYGCPAPQVDLMRQLIKEEFYEMHKDNQLKNFKADVEYIAGIQLPDIPTGGKFDVQQVLESDYFFA